MKINTFFFDFIIKRCDKIVYQKKSCKNRIENGFATQRHTVRRVVKILNN